MGGIKMARGKRYGEAFKKQINKLFGLNMSKKVSTYQEIRHQSNCCEPMGKEQ